MNLKQFIWILVFCLVVSGVAAIRPTIDTQTSGTLVVEAIQTPYFLYNSSKANVNIHVFNSTGYMVTNTTTNCTIHIYNKTGRHQVETLMAGDDNGIDFEYTLPSIVVNDEGVHAYIIQCYNIHEAGFTAGTLTIARGDSLDDPLAYVGVALILIFLVTATLLVGFSLQEEHYPIKLFCIWIGVFMFTLVSQVAVTVAQSNYLDANIINLLTSLNYVTIIMAVVVTGYFMIYVLSVYLNYLADLRKKNSLRGR